MSSDTDLLPHFEGECSVFGDGVLINYENYS